LVNNIVNLNLISIIALISSILLSIDIYLQHLTGADIFGFTSFSGRYNGFFEHEAIAGSYIQKFLLLSLLIVLLLKKKTIVITIIVTILGMGVLLSLDRMPFLMFLLSVFLLSFFLKNLRVIFITNLIIIIALFTFFFKNYEIVKNRYEYFNRDINFHKFIDILKSKDLPKNNNSLDLNSKEKFFHGDYSKLFRAAYLVSLENNFAGSGHKSFIYMCMKIKVKNISCNNHPHNIYLEVLVNLGVIGLTILIVILYFLVNKLISNLFKKNLNKNRKISTILFLVFFIVEFIPFRSYGSIFTTINGSILWFFLGIINYNNNLNEIKN
jgi:O-antigen ligase